LLGLSCFQAFGTYALSRKKQVGFSVLLCFVYACSDEWHQSFVAGRGPSFTDVLIDTAGAAVAVLIATGILLMRRKKARTRTE
jgi:VanZ family protein